MNYDREKVLPIFLGDEVMDVASMILDVALQAVLKRSGDTLTEDEYCDLSEVLMDEVGEIAIGAASKCCYEASRALKLFLDERKGHSLTKWTQED